MQPKFFLQENKYDYQKCEFGDSLWNYKCDSGQPDEVAFAGKSNVGKSSLINALMNRKSLARTSSQPGKTQTINFYNVNEAMYLVDLPGYGYANANIEIKAK